MTRFLLFLKGACMGLADIVPGVSGGTMALILGIYTRFIDAIKGLHLRWIPPLWRWLTRGRKKRHWRAFVDELATLDLAFLITLGLGILTALIAGSMVIPTLMEDYPVQMRAFFFGLILASVWVPLKLISPGDFSSRMVGLVLAVVLGTGFGYVVTNPSNTFELTRHEVTVESQGETLEDLARRAPSAVTTAEIYWSDQNEALRRAVASSAPDEARALEEFRPGGDRQAADKETLKEEAKPFNEVDVPEGVPVQVTRPAHWYVFVAGMIAISAMLLPGISGSYLLLILGVYFFVLNALKGFVERLLDGALPMAQAGYVVLFVSGVGIGLLTFARILSYLLHRFPTYTLGVLVGLMIGCLRGIWPFRRMEEGAVVNTMPAHLGGTEIAALATFAVGMVIVAMLTWLGRKREEKQGAEALP